MIARRLRAHAAPLLITVLTAGSVLGSAACDRVPLTAPTQSTIQLFATGTSVAPNGTVELVATVTEQAGTPVQNGTVVSFTTTLGRIDPAEARTQNGKATVRLIADGRSGVATVTAFSGAAENATLELPIGSAAVETLVVRAEPAGLGSTGGSTQIVALVRDLAGNPLPGASVAFTTTAGSLSSGVVTTDAAGEARTTLTTSREATVTASVGPVTGETTVSVDLAVGLNVTITPDPPIEGRPTNFAIDVTVPDGANPVQRLDINFGDGATRSLSIPSGGGTTNISHIYGDGTFTVTISVIDSAGNTQTQQSIITVIDAPAIPLTVTANPVAPAVGQTVLFTAAATPGAGVSVSRYEWEFGDGSQTSTTANSTTHAYGAAGSRIVRVTAIGSDGSRGEASTVVTVS